MGKFESFSAGSTLSAVYHSSIPFFLSREVPDYWHLAHRTRAEIESSGIKLQTSTKALSIDPKHKTCRWSASNGTEEEVRFQKLVIATGAKSVVPAMDGLKLPGVFFLRWMDEARSVDAYIEKYRVRSVLLVGGGYQPRAGRWSHQEEVGSDVEIERNPTVLKTLDVELGVLVQRELATRGVNVITGQRAESINLEGNGATVLLENVKSISTELVVLATGARPETVWRRAPELVWGKEMRFASINAWRSLVEPLSWHKIFKFRNAFGSSASPSDYPEGQVEAALFSCTRQTPCYCAIPY